MFPFKEIILATIFCLLMMFVIKLGAENFAEMEDCQKKHPHLNTKVIDHKCYYSSEFGWIESGKKVYKLQQKQQRTF